MQLTIRQQLSFLNICIWISGVLSEHRKIIPKCKNSCFEPQQHFNCFCDSKCSLIYNDCCLDAPYRSIRVNSKRLHNIHCIFVHGENRNFWMVDTCKDTFTGHEQIRSKCSASEMITSDVISAVPVTNPNEEVTYKNYYCGICNEDKPDDFVEWEVKAICANENITSLDVLQNITYVEDRAQWGVWKMDAGILKFHECYLLYKKPTGLTDGIRECVPNLVSTCPPQWRNMATRRRCKSYVDPVKWSDGPVYKNIDCAKCNNQTAVGFQCVHDVTGGSSAVMLSRAMTVDLSAMGQWF